MFQNSPYCNQLLSENQILKMKISQIEKAKNNDSQGEIQKLKNENIELLEKVALQEIELNNNNQQLRALNNDKEQVEKYKDIIELLEKKLNAKVTRNAGRKSIVSDETKKSILFTREAGKTIKEISMQYHLSVGLIHKLIHENMD